MIADADNGAGPVYRPQESRMSAPPIRRIAISAPEAVTHRV